MDITINKQPIYVYMYAGNLYIFICSMLSENEVSSEDAAAGCVEAMVQACIACENLQLTASNSSMSGLSPIHRPQWSPGSLRLVAS